MRQIFRFTAHERLFVVMLVGCSVLTLLCASPTSAQTGNAATAGPFEHLSIFGSNNPDSAIVVDHQPLGSFLEVFAVVEGGRRAINYSAARGRGADYLSSYAQFLSTLTPSALRSDEQLAYWLNLRNALVLHAFSEKGGGNFKKLRGAFDAPGEGWTEKRVTVEGIELSIDDIERGIILRNWRNPLVLYGLYQASASGPQLYERGFSGKAVWQELNSVGVKYANVGAALRVRGEVLQLAPVYGWSRPFLFTDDDMEVKAHVASLAADRLRTKVESTTSINYAPFDYRLEKHEPRSVSRELESARSSGGGFPSGS